MRCHRRLAASPSNTMGQARRLQMPGTACSSLASERARLKSASVWTARIRSQTRARLFACDEMRHYEPRLCQSDHGLPVLVVRSSIPIRLCRPRSQSMSRQHYPPSSVVHRHVLVQASRILQLSRTGPMTSEILWATACLPRSFQISRPSITPSSNDAPVPRTASYLSLLVEFATMQARKVASMCE